MLMFITGSFFVVLTSLFNDIFMQIPVHCIFLYLLYIELLVINGLMEYLNTEVVDKMKISLLCNFYYSFLKSLVLSKCMSLVIFVY